MVLDQTQNFVRVLVQGTHSDTATTISLESGEASELPDPATEQYNLVWWDDGNYSRPDQDPNVEIVRATAVDTTNDTVDVNRGQENTSATTKNNSDNDYQMMLSPTSKMFTDIETAEITVNAGTDLATGGSAALGDSVTVDHADTSTQGNVSAGNGAAVTDVNLDGRGHVTSLATTDFDSRFLLASGDDITGNLNFSNADNIQSSSTDAIRFDTNGVSTFPNDTFFDTNIKFGAEENNRIGGFGANNESIRIDVDYNTGSGELNIRFDGSIAFEDDDPNVSGLVDRLIINSGGAFNFKNGDITDGTNTIYSQSNAWVPQARLENDSITLSGGNGLKNGSTAALGGSFGLDVDESYDFTFTSTIDFSSGLLVADDQKTSYGSATDFSVQYESSSDELIIRDESNGVELIRQPKADSTEFLQGADIGSIEAPEDSYTQLTNAPVTDSAAAGDRVGYTFALDNQSFIEIDGEADGSGGIQNTNVRVPQGDLTDGTNVIYSQSNAWVPQARLENDSLTISAGNALTGGGSVSLGTSTTLDVTSGGIQTAELDTSITPTWTDEHSFDGGLNENGVSLSTEASATFYVDEANGSDSNDGTTASSAFASYERAFEEVSRFTEANIEIRQIGDYNSKVILQGRFAGAETEFRDSHIKIVGDSEADAQTNTISEMESVNADFKMYGCVGVGIESLHLNGRPAVHGCIHVNFENCKLGSDGTVFLYSKGSTATTVECELDPQSQNPDYGFYAISKSHIGVGSGTTFQNWDPNASGKALLFSNNSVIFDGEWENGNSYKESDVNREGPMIPTEGITLGHPSLDRGLRGKPLTEVGGETDASSGDIRAANGASIQARNSTDDGDFGITFTSSDTVSIDTDITDGTNTIYDRTNNWIPQTRLENDSLTVTAGNALTGGGSVSLGGSTTVDVATDSIQTAELDLSIAPTWTSRHQFSAGLDISTNDIQIQATENWRLGGSGNDSTVLRLSGTGGAEFEFGTNDATTYSGAYFEVGDTLQVNQSNNENVRVPNGSVTQGFNANDNITETTSPKSWNFDANRNRDIHQRNNVTLSNGSSSSVTEDVTVELYDGVDTTGTLLQSETKSVTVSSGGTKSVEFIGRNLLLDTGTYHVEITTSGTTLTVDESTEFTAGARYTLKQTGSGIGSITAWNASDHMRMNPVTFDVIFPNDITMKSIIKPDSAGSRKVGTPNDYFQEMHASKFKTHSPTISNKVSDSLDSIREYAERARESEASMELSQMVAHLTSVVEQQQKEITKLKEQL